MKKFLPEFYELYKKTRDMLYKDITNIIEPYLDTKRKITSDEYEIIDNLINKFLEINAELCHMEETRQTSIEHKLSEDQHKQNGDKAFNQSLMMAEIMESVKKRYIPDPRPIIPVNPKIIN